MGSLAAWLSAETSSIEFLRPVSIQGQTVLSCISFVPLSLGAIVLAAFARSLLNGVACAASDSFCISANGIPVSPTSLGALKVRERALHATPWIAVTGYSAHTGWDHPLYYDIITTGGLPYVLDLEICPQYSLHAMPKSLLAQVRESPLLPAAADVRRIHARAITTGPTATNESLPAHALPKESYKDRRSGSTGTAVRLSLRSGTAAETQQLVRLQRELYAHAAQHLTTAASARRLAERMLGEQQLDSFRPLRGGWRPRAVQAGGGGLYAAVAGGANASTARRAALASPKLRVLQLLAGSPSVQMTMLRHGFEGLGAEVDERRDKRVRARPLHGRRERAALNAEQLRSVQRLTEVARTRPYHLVVVQLGSEGNHEHHMMLLKALPGLARSRVACVRADANPPPVWSLWAPPFCGRVFVREMRLW